MAEPSKVSVASHERMSAAQVAAVYAAAAIHNIGGDGRRAFIDARG